MSLVWVQEGLSLSLPVFPVGLYTTNCLIMIIKAKKKETTHFFIAFFKWKQQHKVLIKQYSYNGHKQFNQWYVNVNVI